ncbi:MAG: acyltransferase family protein [Roseivirga sp.]
MVHTRRHDIDWLRVIAIGLLLIYHISIGFQPWGGFIGFILSNETMESIWVPMSALNVWRIPLLFFVSGMGVCFAMRKRGWKALIKERALRILMPFLFGMAFIVPLHFLVWQYFYDIPFAYVTQPGHLWFLGNLFAYVLILSPFFYLMKKNEGGKVYQFLVKLFQNPLGLLMVMIPFVLEAIIVNPVSFETYAMTPHGFFIGLLAFFFGFSFMYAGNAFTDTVKKWKYLFLLVALGLYSYRLVELELVAPSYLLSIESNFWIFAVFGIAFTYLNKPSKLLSYLSQAVYPVYIIHMAFLYLGSLLIFPLDISTGLQFFLLIIFTGISCLLTYEFGIRRVRILRPFFGLPYLKKT